MDTLTLVLEKLFNKTFRHSFIIRLYRLFRMAESTSMRVRVARMAETLQIIIIKH